MENLPKRKLSFLLRVHRGWEEWHRVETQSETMVMMRMMIMILMRFLETTGCLTHCDSLYKHLFTHRRNIKIRVLSTDVVIRQITKACFPCPESSSRHRQCQRMLPPMATLENTTADKQGREQGIKSACTACNFQKPPVRMGKPKHAAAPPRLSNRRTCSLDKQNYAPQSRCNGKLYQKKDVQGSISLRSLLP